MEFESSLQYSEKFSIGVYPAPDKSCENLHTYFFKIYLNTVMPPQNDHIFKVVFFPIKYSNKIYVCIYYSTMENASSIYYILLFVYYPA